MDSGSFKPRSKRQEAGWVIDASVATATLYDRQTSAMAPTWASWKPMAEEEESVNKRTQVSERDKGQETDGKTEDGISVQVRGIN